MALYPDRLVLPLERISYVTTHSLDKKELLQWVHISGRRDLTVVFEKESPTGSIGLFDQQTSFKINEGTKVVESVTLEDFVCQAAVAERRLSSSPNSPPPFAIFTSTPNLAYRYQLYNGHYRKIQLLFRDDPGFNSAVSILRNFNLPIVDKSVVSQQRADPVIDASSISSYGQRGTTTVLSRPSDNDRTNSTALSWHEPIRSVASGIDQSMGDSTRNFGANFGSLLPRQSSNVVLRPGPSLLESIVHVNHHNDHSSEQYFHTDTSQPRNFNLDLLNDRREGLLRRTLFDGRAIDFSNEVVSPVRRLDLSARAPTPSWLSEIPPEYDNAPPSGQKRMYKPSQELSQVPKPDQIDITSTHMLKSNHNSNAGAQATNNSQQDAMSTRLTVNKRSIGTNRAKSSQSLLPKKAGATKRGSRKNFVSAATQTGYKSVPKTTQTDPVEVTPIEDDEAPNKSFPNFTQGQGNTILGSLGASLHQQNKPAVIEDMIMTETQILLRRSALRINKFSSRGNFNSSPTQDVDARLTSLEEDKSLFLPLAMQNHKQRRSGNKFARRRNLSEA